MIAVGGVNQGVRGENRRQRRAAAPGGVEDAGAVQLDPGRLRARAQRAQCALGEAARGSAEARELPLRLREGEAFERVIGLFRSCKPRLAQLEPFAQDDARLLRRAGEEHRRRPPRVRCDPQYPRGRLHGRYSASALIGRLMSERTASLALRCWYSTR